MTPLSLRSRRLRSFLALLVFRCAGPWEALACGLRPRWHGRVLRYRLSLSLELSLPRSHLRILCILICSGRLSCCCCSPIAWFTPPASATALRVVIRYDIYISCSFPTHGLTGSLSSILLSGTCLFGFVSQSQSFQHCKPSLSADTFCSCFAFTSASSSGGPSLRDYITCSLLPGRFARRFCARINGSALIASSKSNLVNEGIDYAYGSELWSIATSAPKIPERPAGAGPTQRYRAPLLPKPALPLTPFALVSDGAGWLSMVSQTKGALAPTMLDWYRCCLPASASESAGD